MDQNHEKIADILREFWTDHQADRPDGGGCYDEPDARQIEDLLAKMRQVEGQVLFLGQSVTIEIQLVGNEKKEETEIILRPGPMHRKTFREALAAISKEMVEDHDLLVWTKAREMMCTARASKEKAASVYDPKRPRDIADYPTERAKSLQIGVYLGRAEAYHDVWRQILFPGVSVQDGTLDPETAAKAEEEWTAIAEEVLRQKCPKRQ